MPGRRRHPRAPLYARRLERAIELDCEVVLALHSSGWGLGARAAPGVPVVAITNGQPKWLGPHMRYYVKGRVGSARLAVRATGWLQRRVQDRLLARADLVVALSEYGAATLPDPVSVVYPPVDLERFNGPGDRDGHVIAVSRLVAHKRIDLLLEAVRGRPESLVVVGTGSELPRLRRSAPPNVEFVGAVGDDELAGLLGSARALVNPGIEEFGIAMVEALASGIPVIAPRAGGALEIVTDGLTGHLLSQMTAGSIAAALDSLVFEPAACRAAAARFGQRRFFDELGATLDAARAGIAAARAGA
jgi:glycosyltransferase involved in cell wall biosynthesis